MPTIPREKLSRFFQSFAPEYVIGTTYTISLAFFESVVFPCINKKKLRKCLLLCDRTGFQRATSEAIALRSATREYMVATAPAEKSFHPKVWLLLNEQRLALLVGSGNLTQSGFIDNTELFEAVELDAGGPGLELCQSVTDFLRGIQQLWQISSQRTLLAVDVLNEVERATTEFAASLQPAQQDTPRFLSSFDGPFGEKLRDILGQPAKSYVAAPYFGGSTAGLRLLQSSTGTQHTAVFPAVHADGKLDVNIEEVERLEYTSAHLSKLAAKKNQFAHLKQYGFEQPDGGCWLFTGSVNCTVAALSAQNIEAGILRPVSRDTLDEYFAISGQRNLPRDQRDASYETDSNWLTFWATDLGDSIEIVAESRQATHLPLQHVHIVLTAGAKRATVTRPALFEAGLHCRLSWNEFLEAKRSSQAARVLEIQGEDASGVAIRGTAFIDDLVALTSEPVHRGAWRAALTLLSSEALPEYSDIAALFQLVEDVVAGEDVDEADDDGSANNRGAGPAGSTREALRDKAAVWPPEPIEADMSMLSKGQGTGDLFWFNRILASLVQPRASDNDDTETHTSAQLSDDNDERDGPSPRVVSACNRMWSNAYDGLCKLENQLYDMEPSAQTARRIWGPATFIFLSTLGIKKAVQTTTQDELETPSCVSLANDFVTSLLAERDQGDGFNTPQSCRYDHEIFPSIAWDLAETYGVHPHFEICAVVATAFAHLYAAQPHSFQLLAWLTYRDTAGDNHAESCREEAHLEHVWQRYFNDGRDGLSWQQVSAAHVAIGELGWREHPGMQSLLVRRSQVEANKCVVVDDYSGACSNFACRSLGKIDAQAARELRELSPATCKACGFILVPELLWQAYTELQDG